MRRSITGRWLVNGIGIVMLVLVFLVLAVTLAMRQLYYSGVRETLYEYAETTAGTFDMYLSDSSYDWTTASREFLQNFRDKSQVEVQVLDPSGRAQRSTTGFAPTQGSRDDWEEAMLSADGYGQWEGRIHSGEHVMSLVTVRRRDGHVIGALRYVVSVRLIDRQIVMIGGAATLLSLVILFFVFLSNSYFISSILNPIKEIGRGAQKIASGNFRYRIKKRGNDELGDLCDTINYMAGEIGRTEEMKNDFLSSISHELRTPLTAIKGWSETLEQVGSENTELTRRGLRVIADETDRLSALVEELLDFSRLQSGRLDVRFEKFDLLAELEETVLLYQPRAERDGITLLYAESPELPLLTGDKDRIRQVLINLLDNAIKYSAAGDTVRVEAARLWDRVQIVISDTGMGIPPEALPHITEKFFRVNKNGTIPGSGIGLALVKEVIRLHDGHLDIESEFGVGTTVTITLPLMADGIRKEVK